MLKGSFKILLLVALMAAIGSLNRAQEITAPEAPLGPLGEIYAGPATEDRPLLIEIHSPASFEFLYAEPSRLTTSISDEELVLQLTYLPRMTVSSYWHLVINGAEPVGAEAGECCPTSFTGANICLIEYVRERLGIIGPECFSTNPIGAPLRITGEIFVRYIEDTNTILIRPVSP